MTTRPAHVPSGHSVTDPAHADDPAAVLAVLSRAPAVHPYGIADVAQLWDATRWWVDGDAVVGVLDLPGSPAPVVYAVAAGATATTLDLLAALEASGRLPDHLVATWPRGAAARLALGREVRWARDHWKMALVSPDELPPAHDAVRVLDRDDLDALLALFATDPSAGDFFHPGLLDTEAYVGVEVADRLVAVAGVHVLDRTHGVAAIGNVATHPAHRRRGHGRRALASLCHHLLDTGVPVLGLNVAADNHGALALYRGLGFSVMAPYEEAELVRTA